MSEERPILPGTQPVMLHHTDSILIAASAIYAAMLSNHLNAYREDPMADWRAEMMDFALAQAHELLERQYSIHDLPTEGTA